MAKNERVAVYAEHEQGDNVEESEDDKEVRKRGKEVAVEKPGSSKKGNEVRRENKAPSSNVGEGTPTVSKRGKRAALTTVEKSRSSKKCKETVKSGTTDDVPQGVGAPKRKTGEKGRKDLVPEGVGVFIAESGNFYLKMSATGAPILINEAKISEANNKRKVASSSKPKTRSAAALETHHQAVASRNSLSLTTDAVISSSKPRNSPSKTKQKTTALTVRTRANSKPKTRSAATKAKTKVWK
ncbi:hypothetical protein IFM89_005564 [Coptis chinensis]|uniref:Uncharacterized protein n=1 Tax=Coptis chinensis TaxID=261450 RepID=A0A835H4N6_9MAGN|nr:hypothetical protein IFM89_005564 [Coptis chinensis]